jgi:hypothetical protein
MNYVIGVRSLGSGVSRARSNHNATISVLRPGAVLVAVKNEIKLMQQFTPKGLCLFLHKQVGRMMQQSDFEINVRYLLDFLNKFS